MSGYAVYLPEDNSFAEECTLTLIDNVRNEMAMFEAMIGIDLYESKLMKESPVNESGITALNESANQGIISKIIDMIRSFFKKIGDIFRSFFKKTSSETKSSSDIKKQVEERAKQDKERIARSNKTDDNSSVAGGDPAQTKSGLPSVDEMSVKMFELKNTLQDATDIEIDAIQRNSVFLVDIDDRYLTMDKQEIIADLLGCKPEEYEEKLMNDHFGKSYEVKLKELGGITGLTSKITAEDKKVADCEKRIEVAIKDSQDFLKDFESRLYKNSENGVFKQQSGKQYQLSEIYRVQAAFNESIAIRSKAVMKVIKRYSKIYRDVFDQVMTDKDHVIVF